VPTNFNTKILSHVMAKGLQRFSCDKGSLSGHLQEFSDVCASYVQGLYVLLKDNDFYLPQ